MSVTRYRKGILSVPRLYAEEIDTRVGDLELKRLGVAKLTLQVPYNLMRQDMKLASNMKIRDSGDVIIFDPDDAGGITTLANVASATTFNSIAVQEPFLKGVANRRFVPCVFIGDAVNLGITWSEADLGITNPDADDIKPIYQVLLPPLMYGKKLYVKDVRLCLTDADATNYVSRVGVYRVLSGTASEQNFDATTRNTINTFTSTFTAIDMSTAHSILIKLTTSLATALALNIESVEAECYYDT